MKHYDTWARQIKTREEIPAAFEEFFTSAAGDQPGFPYTVFAPPDRWGRRKTAPKLVCLLNDRIAICEKHNKDFKTIEIPFRDVIFLESGTALLYSWIKIVGMTPEGSMTTTIEFNTVVEAIFKPVIEGIRVGANGLDRAEDRKEALKQEQVKFDIYTKSHYKFMNYAKRSILPGENVVEQVLQPDVVVKFMKYFKKLAVTSHLTILTDRELITIRDVDSIRYKNQVRYGGVWCFIPLAKICDVSLAVNGDIKKHPEDDLVTFRIALTGSSSVNSRFEPLHQTKLESLIRRVKTKDYGFERECG